MVAHPNHNEASIEVAVSDLLKFAEHVQHEPVWLDLEVAELLAWQPHFLDFLITKVEQFLILDLHEKAWEEK